MGSLANLTLSELRAQKLNEIEEWFRLKNRPVLQALIQKSIEQEVLVFLGREKHRKSLKGKLFKASYPCPHCKETWSRQFNRNGYYHRQVLTLCGLINLKIPRIKCKSCKNKFNIQFEVLTPRSRLWLDVTSMNSELYGMRASFSLIQQFIFRRTKEWLGKFTLMSKVRKLTKTERTGTCPSEVGFDGMHIRSQKKNRNKNAVILLATDIKQSEILDYEWCHGETKQDYDRFVKRMEKNFKLNPRDLENIVSDGNHAILATTDSLSQYHTICSFHILQNIRINAPSFNTAKKLMHEAAPIFKQASYAGAIREFEKLEQKWHSLAPEVLKNLRRSIEKTKDAWVSPNFSKTDNVTERRIRDIRRKSKAMDNFRSQATSEAVMEMVIEQIKNFKPLGNWFAPIQKRLFV